MALTISLTPGAVVGATDLITAALLNLIANPTIALEGSVGSLTLADGSVTTPKLLDGVLSADSVGRAKMADSFITLAKILDGIFTADAPGRAKFAAGFITATQLATDAVTVLKIQDGAVSGAKLAANVQNGSIQFAQGTFGAGVYTVTLSPAQVAYAQGQVVRFKASAANTGSASVNVNGLGNKTLQKEAPGGAGLVNLAANDIITGQIVECVYDGTVFQVTTALPTAFVSAEQTVAAGGVIGNLAHGLGGVPSLTRWVLVCKTGESNYAIGDEVDVSSLRQDATLLNQFSWGASATNVWLVALSATTRLQDKSLGSDAGALTPANWRAKCYARL